MTTRKLTPAEAELADAMAFAAMWKQRAEASEARGEA